MRIFFFYMLLLIAFRSNAQNNHLDTANGRLAELRRTMDSATLNKVELESEFPGGDAAWNRFLLQNMRYPSDAVKNNIEGTVVIQFIVDKDGAVSNIQAVKGPEDGGLREEAIRIIRKSGKWLPAIQYGRYVKSYKRQPFLFKLSNG